eukprot:GHRQ01016827.1.p2 GENE.GHRQ01016827.1~~GHRQ01016827.1.p2  ORF type:complete len:159 (+),score=22.18 GHRQ01016827.1:125-601(+)
MRAYLELRIAKRARHCQHVAHATVYDPAACCFDALHFLNDMVAKAIHAVLAGQLHSHASSVGDRKQHMHSRAQRDGPAHCKPPDACDHSLLSTYRHNSCCACIPASAPGAEPVGRSPACALCCTDSSAAAYSMAPALWMLCCQAIPVPAPAQHCQAVA